MAGCATTSIHADYDAFRGFDANQRQEDSSGAQLYTPVSSVPSYLRIIKPDLIGSRHPGRKFPAKVQYSSFRIVWIQAISNKLTASDLASSPHDLYSDEYYY